MKRKKRKSRTTRKTRPKRAVVVREYGPFPGVGRMHGVTYDGRNVWFARGDKLVAIDPASGDVVRELDIPGDGGTAFDGRYLWQLTAGQIKKIDPETGRVVGSIPAPAPGSDSGLAWAEGTLWVGEYRARKIHQIDAETGAILRTIESDRFVTGVSWVDGELWHATMEGGASELRRIDPASGEVLERLAMPEGAEVTGLEGDGKGLFFCGGADSGVVRAVRKPRGDDEGGAG